MTQYVFVWDLGVGEPVVANLCMKNIAWMIGTRGARHVRVWWFHERDLIPVELTPMINRETHVVALWDPNTGRYIDQAEYPTAG